MKMVAEVNFYASQIEVGEICFAGA